MPDTSSKNNVRGYTRSSSFQMAILFTVLCGAAVIILGYFGYYFNRGHFIHGTEAVIETEIHHASLWNTQEGIEAALQNKNRVFLLLDQNDQKLTGNLKALPEPISLLAEGTILFDLDEQKYAAWIHSFALHKSCIL